jgi:hypothetical protein
MLGREKEGIVLHDAVRSICARTGWKEPQADDQGVYAFSLEGDLSFTLSSPDGERLLARSTLLAPKAGQEIAVDTAAAVMHIAAARFARLKAVTALEPETGKLELYALTNLRGEDESAQAAFMENFLNELSFWKVQPALSAPAPFVARR